MRNLFATGFIFMLLLSGCGWDGTPTRNNDFTPLTAITISAVSSTIAAHTSTHLTATGDYSGSFSRDITAQVVWSSSEPTVAAFVSPSAPNFVTGQSPGTAVLTATVGQINADFTLTVSPATVTGLTITPAAATLTKGLSRQFSVSGSFSDATSQDLTFDADWASSVPAVATISNDPGSKGLSRATGVGDTSISATFSGISSSTQLIVIETALQSIAISPANPTLLSLSRADFTAIGSYSDGSTADITSQVAWSSTSSDIAAVSSSGAVKTLMSGATSIKAAVAGVTGTASLKVTGGNLTGIAITPLNPLLVKGTTRQISASGTFSNGSSRDISGAVDWTVAHTDVATVTTPGGNLAWLNPGTVNGGSTVTAKAGIVFADTTLTVTSPLLRDITLAPASLEQTTGTSDQFRVTATFSDGSSQEVTASSDWSADAVTVATVGNSGIAKGLVTAVAIGATNISASYGGITKKSFLSVKARTLRELTISGTTSAVVGNQLVLTAIAEYTDGTSKDVTRDAAWSIDKTSIVALADPVNQPGQIIMVDAGTATLTTSFGSISRTVTLTARGL